MEEGVALERLRIVVQLYFVSVLPNQPANKPATDQLINRKSWSVVASHGRPSSSVGKGSLTNPDKSANPSRQTRRQKVGEASSAVADLQSTKKRRNSTLKQRTHSVYRN